MHVPQAGDQKFAMPVDDSRTGRNCTVNRRNVIAIDDYGAMRECSRRRDVNHSHVVDRDGGSPGKARQKGSGEKLHSSTENSPSGDIKEMLPPFYPLLAGTQSGADFDQSRQQVKQPLRRPPFAIASPIAAIIDRPRCL